MASSKIQASSKKGKQPEEAKHIGIVANDPYLEPYEDAIRGRHDHALWKISQLTDGGKITLGEFADGYKYYGLHHTGDGWVFREWAPNATGICPVGDFNGRAEQLPRSSD